MAGSARRSGRRCAPTALQPPRDAEYPAAQAAAAGIVAQAALEAAGIERTRALGTRPEPSLHTHLGPFAVDALGQQIAAAPSLVAWSFGARRRRAPNDLAPRGPLAGSAVRADRPVRARPACHACRRSGKVAGMAISISHAWAARATRRLLALAPSSSRWASSAWRRDGRRRPSDRRAGAGRSSDASSHVAVIVMENKEASNVLGNAGAPYLNAAGTALRSGDRELRDPTSVAAELPRPDERSTHGIASDCTELQRPVDNIVDQLVRAGISWKAYLEDYPGRCFAGAECRPLREKAQSVHLLPRHCGQPGPVRKSGGLRSPQRRSTGTPPADLCLDHTESLRRYPRLQRRHGRPLPRPHGAGTAGEIGPAGSSSSPGTRAVPTAAAAATSPAVATSPRSSPGRGVIPGSRLRTSIDHYGVLATIERALALPLLGGAAYARSGRLTALFGRPPVIR